MSTGPPPPPPPPLPQLNFAPIHRTVQLENIHEQVTKTDSQQPQPTSSTRKILTKCMTVIGDGSDIDTCKILTQ
jgi:hypothetical protein